MTDRHTVNSITSDALDQLYDQLAAVREAADWTRSNYPGLRSVNERFTAALTVPAATEATEPPAWAPPPPGDTREQLPPAVLALLPTHPYLSTACDTADAVACTATNRHPLHDELRAHAERLHARCRLNHKFTGQLCTCGCHETAPAATEATEPQEQP